MRASCTASTLIGLGGACRHAACGVLFTLLSAFAWAQEVEGPDRVTELVVLLTDVKKVSTVNLGEARALAEHVNELCDRAGEDRRQDGRVPPRPGIVGALCASAYELHVTLAERNKRLTKLYSRVRTLVDTGHPQQALDALTPLPSDAPSNDPDLPFLALRAHAQERLRSTSTGRLGGGFSLPDFPWRRIYLSVSQTALMAAPPFTDERSFILYGQGGNLSTSYQFRQPRLGRIDVSGWVRAWDRVAIGGGYSDTLGFGNAEVAGTVPSPSSLFLARTISTSLTNLNRSERSLHVGVGAVVDTDRATLTVLAGPSLVRLSLDTIESFRIQELAANRMALIPEVVETRSKSRVGVHVVLDGSWMFLDALGCGAFMRYTHAEIALEHGGTDPLTMSGGGLTTGWGLRLRF